MSAFRSVAPEIKLVNVFNQPYNNAVATARTCYSSTIIDLENVSGVNLAPEKQEQRQALRDRIASSIYEAGHHTTLQHAHVQFTLANVSRHFLWSFLHASPFYNSEQQSQRYVHMKPDKVIIPDFKDPKAQAVYERVIARQMASYERLTDLLTPVAAAQYYKIFPARRKKDQAYVGEIQKKAQEVARYVLPVGMFANLYHTVSLLTLLRYHHMAAQYDLPSETRLVVNAMVEQVLDYDPLIKKVLEEPLSLEDMPETRWFQEFVDPSPFIKRFDQSLAGQVSKLVDYSVHAETVIAESVREVLGLTPERLSDEAALDLVLNPQQNAILSTTLNNNTLSKLTRVLHHGHYTFRKKISHTADSQDQRHRMVPGSRPVLGLHLTETPDYITPRLFFEDQACLSLYQETMAQIWEGINELRALDAPVEFLAYLLPNGVSIRFSESGDLLNLHHKLKARLCYNAQEEIWQASLDELAEISQVHPRIAQYLLPPCGLRKMGARTPFCPEGARYCGVPVWKLEPSQYQRVI